MNAHTTQAIWSLYYEQYPQEVTRISDAYHRGNEREWQSAIEDLNATIARDRKKLAS